LASDTAAKASARGGRKAAMAFIYVTIVLDTLGFGITIPVLPRLIVSFAPNTAAGAVQHEQGDGKREDAVGERLRPHRFLFVSAFVAAGARLRNVRSRPVNGAEAGAATGPARLPGANPSAAVRLPARGPSGAVVRGSRSPGG